MFPKKCRSCSVSFKTSPTESQHGLRRDCHPGMWGPCCALRVRCHGWPQHPHQDRTPPYPAAPTIAFGAQSSNQHPQTPPQDSSIHWGAEIKTGSSTGLGAAHPCGVSEFHSSSPGPAAARARHTLCMSWDALGGETDPQESVQGRRALSCSFPPPAIRLLLCWKARAASPPPLQQSSAEGCRILQGAGVFSMQERVRSRALSRATEQPARSSKLLLEGAGRLVNPQPLTAPPLLPI